ncbi:hypothetical protein EYF80_031477 [Liparis tanakae]|uniref:Uncharacterized protein n=1 Tax=Liparis tanakae TaxID=230148 RepID=A0A4Z2H0C0_9TELE|nr:hypothetical protein EYF80_031477 [Liparis tanakae]
MHSNGKTREKRFTFNSFKTSEPLVVKRLVHKSRGTSSGLAHNILSGQSLQVVHVVVTEAVDEEHEQRGDREALQSRSEQQQQRQELRAERGGASRRHVALSASHWK